MKRGPESHKAWYRPSTCPPCYAQKTANSYGNVVLGLYTKLRNLQSSTTSIDAPPSLVTRRRVFINIYRLPNWFNFGIWIEATAL